MDALKKFDTLALIIVTSLVAVDAYVWFVIFSQTGLRTVHEYVLDVGQGDSELVAFPGGVKIMTDAGPGSAVVDSLQKVIPEGDRYIDIATISHPDSDHFAGYIDILDRYDIGAFVYNGRDGDSAAWRTLMDKIAAKHIPLVTLAAGDGIQYEKNTINILSPDAAFIGSAETNDTSLVEMVHAPTGGGGKSASELRTLLTGDAPSNIEGYLMKNGADLRADVLKVAHHGSKYASGSAFLRAVDPKVAAIGVGAKNVYGHPSKDVLARIASSTSAAVFRTDWNGTVDIFFEDGKLKVLTEKE